MLGLLDPTRPRREATTASTIDDRSEPPAAPRSLVDTEAAAEALRTTTTSLHRFAQARIVTPARVDPDGTLAAGEVRGAAAGVRTDNLEEKGPVVVVELVHDAQGGDGGDRRCALTVLELPHRRRTACATSRPRSGRGATGHCTAREGVLSVCPDLLANTPDRATLPTPSPLAVS